MCGEAQGGSSTRPPMLQKESFRAINSKRGRRSDKSVCIPKLSALRHRCLRFLLLREKKTRMRLLWLLQHGILLDANHRRAQITQASTRGGRQTNLQKQPSAWPKCLSKQPHGLFILPRCRAALSCLYLIPRSPPPPPCPIITSQREFRREPALPTPVPVLLLRHHNDLLSSRSSAACSPVATSRPLTRMRN